MGEPKTRGRRDPTIGPEGWSSPATLFFSERSPTTRHARSLVTGLGSVTMAGGGSVSGEIETYYEYGAWRNWSGGQDIGRAHEVWDDAVAEGRHAAAERHVGHIIRDEHGTVVECTAQA